MSQIKLIFEKSGTLYIDLNKKAPETIKRVIDILPFNSDVIHTRWCGREISFGIKTQEKPPLENSTTIVSKFDFAYWTNWGSEDKIDEAPSSETLAIYYGPELLRYHNGFIKVNVIGRARREQEELLEKIGRRIWQKGKEKVRVEKV